MATRPSTHFSRIWSVSKGLILLEPSKGGWKTGALVRHLWWQLRTRKESSLGIRLACLILAGFALTRCSGGSPWCRSCWFRLRKVWFPSWTLASCWRPGWWHHAAHQAWSHVAPAPPWASRWHKWRGNFRGLSGSSLWTNLRGSWFRLRQGTGRSLPRTSWSGQGSWHLHCRALWSSESPCTRRSLPIPQSFVCLWLLLFLEQQSNHRNLL